MIKRLLILLGVCFTFVFSKAQVDTSFWFVAPDVSQTLGQTPVVLHVLTYDQTSIVHIRQPALSISSSINTSVSIAANSVFTLDLSSFAGPNAPLESAPVNSVSGKGIYISSKELVSVYYTIGAGGHKEMISLKGQSALGTEFYVSLPRASALTTHTVPDGGVGFDVVATQTGVTTILITPRANCVGRPQNVTFSRTLTIGQTFSMLDASFGTPSQLAGSIISSDRPVAVTVKGSLSNSASICSSMYAEQITPATELGLDYVVMRGNGTADMAFILARQNATSFTIASAGGTVNSLINATETFSVNITDPITYIKSDRPVYMFHMSGFGCRQSGTQLAPALCAGSYSSAFVRLSPDSLCLNICTRANAQGSFALLSNNVSIPIAASSFSAVPGSNGILVAARLYFPVSQVPVGSYNLLTNTSDVFNLSVHNGGTSGGSSYAQASSFKSTVIVQANAAPVATICANNQFTLNGLVGGGPNTGQWSIINGYGTLSGSVTQLTNNVYSPALLDTTNNDPGIPVTDRYVKIVLRSTGICPNYSDTFRLHVRQPPIVSAGANSVICGNQNLIQLNGLVYGATNSGSWTVLPPASGSFIAGVTSFTPVYGLTSADTVQTQISFVLVSTNNGFCNAVTNTVQVFINKPPIVIASNTKPLYACSNNATVSLGGVVQGTASSTGIWQTSGSGLFTPNNLSLNGNYLPSFTDINNGTVWLRLESTNNGLCLPTRDSVQVIFTEPSFVNAGSDINTCANAPFAQLGGVITGTNTSSVSWVGGSGTFSPGANVINPGYIASASEIGAGFVTLTLTTINNGQCIGSQDELRINFQPKPLANFSVSAVCNGQITFFSDKSLNQSTAGLINGWQWTFGEDSAGSVQKDPQHFYKGPGTYLTRLIVKNSFGCYDTIQKNVVVNAVPTASFTFDRDCSGSAQLINFRDRSTIEFPDVLSNDGQYWDFGGYGYSYAKDTSVVFPSEGVYSVSHRVVSGKGCQAVITKTVDIKPRPIARFIYLSNNNFGVGANVQFRDTSLYAQSWSWDFGNGSTSKERYPGVSYSENGTYTVSLEITDEFGCPSSYSLEVKISTIVSEILQLVPNLITPNNDGKNDLWRLDFIEVFFPKAEIAIFNRWGEQIFSSIGYSNAWDGSYKGNPLPVGVYYYTIDLKDSESPVLKGSVTLMK